MVPVELVVEVVGVRPAHVVGHARGAEHRTGQAPRDRLLAGDHAGALEALAHDPIVVDEFLDVATFDLVEDAVELFGAQYAAFGQRDVERLQELAQPVDTFDRRFVIEDGALTPV